MPFIFDFSRKNHCSHALILPKNVHSLKKHNAFTHIFFKNRYVHYLKNTVLSCHIFQIFYENPPAVIPIFVQKNVNYVKTTLYCGLKKAIGCPFFPIFHEKIYALMPIFCQQNVHSLKKTLLQCRYFVKKTFILLKKRCSHVIFSNFS